MIALMFLAVLLVYLGIAWLVVKRLPNKKAKWIAVAAFILIPSWDEIAGRVYLSHLCATETRVKVYHTVELPAEYWDEQGGAKFYDEKNGNFNLTQIGTDFKNEKYPSMFPIKKFRFWYFEKQNGKILGEIIDFGYAGGWISRNFNPAPGGGSSCERPVLQSSREIMYSIFRPARVGQNSPRRAE